MNFETFCYWLQGYFELSRSDVISKEQREIIEEHLNQKLKLDINPSYGLNVILTDDDLRAYLLRKTG